MMSRSSYRMVESSILDSDFLLGPTTHSITGTSVILGEM